MIHRKKPRKYWSHPKQNYDWEEQKPSLSTLTNYSPLTTTTPTTTTYTALGPDGLAAGKKSRKRRRRPAAKKRRRKERKSISLYFKASQFEEEEERELPQLTFSCENNRGWDRGWKCLAFPFFFLVMCTHWGPFQILNDHPSLFPFSLHWLITLMSSPIGGRGGWQLGGGSAKYWPRGKVFWPPGGASYDFLRGGRGGIKGKKEKNSLWSPKAAKI